MIAKMHWSFESRCRHPSNALDFECMMKLLRNLMPPFWEDAFTDDVTFSNLRRLVSTAAGKLVCGWPEDLESQDVNLRDWWDTVFF